MIGKLGRLPKREDPRTVQLEDVLRFAGAKLPVPPPARDWTHAFLADGTLGKAHRFEMFGNSQYGCCTHSSIGGHYDQLAAFVLGGERRVFLDQVLDGYDNTTGWERDQPTKNDNGGHMLDALRYWHQSGKTVGAYAEFKPENRAVLELAVNLGLSAYLGLDLPVSINKQMGKVWDVDPTGKHQGDYERNSMGGHAVICAGYNAIGPVYVTWARRQQVTWEWHRTYAMEAYFVAHRKVLDAKGLEPCGYVATEILAALRSV